MKTLLLEMACFVFVTGAAVTVGLAGVAGSLLRFAFYPLVVVFTLFRGPSGRPGVTSAR
jgi:hypothetical protein